MAKQILRIIAVLTMCVSDASAQEADTGALHDNGVVEEVVVTGEHECGSWPIAHEGLGGCEYAELKKDDLQMVLNLRAKFLIHVWTAREIGVLARCGGQIG